jgi:hypothetical protein
MQWLKCYIIHMKHLKCISSGTIERVIQRASNRKCKAHPGRAWPIYRVNCCFGRALDCWELPCALNMWWIFGSLSLSLSFEIPHCSSLVRLVFSICGFFTHRKLALHFGFSFFLHHQSDSWQRQLHTFLLSNTGPSMLFQVKFEALSRPYFLSGK